MQLFWIGTMALTCEPCLNGDQFRCIGRGCANYENAKARSRRYVEKKSGVKREIRSTSRPVTSRRPRSGRLADEILLMLKAGYSLEGIRERISGRLSPCDDFEEQFGHEHITDIHRRLRRAVHDSLREGYPIEWVDSHLSGQQKPDFTEGMMYA